MATIIMEGKRKGVQVVSLVKGEVFFVSFIIPEGMTEGVVKISRTESGSNKVEVKKDVVAVVEGLHKSLQGCKHLRFLREERMEEGLDFVQPKAWPKMRVALGHAGVKIFHVPGGFKFAVAYGDEIAIPNYSMAGSNGWIIRRKDISKYLKALPALEDSGEIGMLWVDHVGWLNTPDECSINIVDHDPTDKEPPSYYDRPRGYHVSSNRQIFRVEYDKGSRLVKRVVNQGSKEECRAVCYKIRPAPRGIEVGKRLPTRL